jgi:hypothetical protein
MGVDSGVATANVNGRSAYMHCQVVVQVFDGPASFCYLYRSHLNDGLGLEAT